MAIRKDDYIEGMEYYGFGTQIVRGWVDNIYNDGEYFSYDIQADDGWKGARGTTIHSELGKVTKLEAKERPIKNR